jgi:tRNA-2-methylthio-N6-dimethylallyladenosine synthase
MAEKRVFIKTYGCQMNVYDSARMADMLTPLGFESVDDMDDADMVILNTCHIREKAAEKVYSELGRIKQMKDERSAKGKDTVIVVAGCTGQAEGEEVFKRAPYVDMVVGPQSYQNLPRLIMELNNNNRSVVDLDFAPNAKFDYLPEESAPQGPSAFLSIQEGCNEFCKFCVVPYTRGAEFSRSIPQIFREAVKLVSQGAREITLLGQNVNAYNGLDHTNNTGSLADLIKAIAHIDGLKRIRYTTSHPRNMADDLIEAHGSEPKLMPFIHLPVQSGSDKILHEMNRKHTAAYYLKVIEKLRSIHRDIAFSSDFIVGYPGETEDDFQATLDLVKTVRYAQAYSFKYSPRPGTPAAMYTDQVPEEIKSDRLARLQELLITQQTEFNNSMLGKVVNVLFDRSGKHDGQLIGKTPWMQSVVVRSNATQIGGLMDVKIIGASQNSLTGEFVHNVQAA